MQTQEQSQSDITTETKKPYVKSVCCGIYGLRNKANGKWYIGLSTNIEVRWDKYRRLKCESQPKIYSALQKYGYDGFDKVILESCTPNELNDREIYWVKEKNSINNGYNILEGGRFAKLTPESIEKIRIKAIGRKPTEETRSKLRAARARRPRKEKKEKVYVEPKKRIYTEEQRRKMSERRKGRKVQPFTDEHRMNISMAKKGISTKKHTEETKNKMRLIALVREQKKRELATNQKV
jgi:group I intron endonuclease